MDIAVPQLEGVSKEGAMNRVHDLQSAIANALRGKLMRDVRRVACKLVASTFYFQPGTRKAEAGASFSCTGKD